MATTPRSLAKMYAQVKGTKLYYDILLIEHGNSPNCCNKWETKLGGEIDWKACFTKAKKKQEIKLKWFQIRLLHRILATTIVLKEMGIVQSALRDFCNLVRDSLQHYMRVYQHVKSFWKELEKFICQNCENVHNFKFD